MNKVERYLKLAVKISRLKMDDRTYFHSAIAIRADGTMVVSYNGACNFPEPQAHAEARVLKKAGKNSILYVVRSAADGITWANSTPCESCWKKIKSSKVKKVIYTTGPNEYSVLRIN